MRTIRIYGLLTSDATVETTEDIILNGTTPAVSVNTWYRIYRAKGLTYGSGGNQNVGTITVRHSTTTANVFAGIPIGRGQTAIAAWTCPAESTAYLIGLYVPMARANGSPGSAQISLRIREFGTSGYNASRSYEITDSNPANPPLKFPVKIPAKADIKVRADSVSDANTIVTADLDILIASS